jgi:hypothetical protein
MINYQTSLGEAIDDRFHLAEIKSINRKRMSDRPAPARRRLRVSSVCRACVGVGETAGIDEFHLQSYTRLYLKAR